MSETSEAVPQARWAIGFGTVMRLLPIALGIMSALALARDGLGFKLILFLDAVITAYGILFDDLFKDLVLALFEPLFAFLRTWFDLHWDLYAHWKHCFVLVWLLQASFLRHQSSIFDAYKYQADYPSLGYHAFVWIWAAFAALLGSTLAGTVPLDHPAILWWPVAAWFLNRAGQEMFYVASKLWWNVLTSVLVPLGIAATFALIALGQVPIVGDRPSVFWPVAAVLVFYAADWFATGMFHMMRRMKFKGTSDAARGTVAIVLAAVTLLFAIGLAPPFESSPSPGLANLAVFVTAIACWYLLIWLLLSWGGSTSVAGFLDILAVLGGAAFLVWLGHALA